MTGRQEDMAVTLPWMDEGTDLFLSAVAGLTDAELDDSSALPGWTRRHVVAHVARNAEALDRLLEWAQTGVETPMYGSPAQRGDDIERSQGFPAEQLRHEAAGTAAALRAHVDRLTPGEWGAPVRSAKGRAIAAREVPWMRSREVWLHTLDLGCGTAADALPPAFCEVLIADVLGSFGAGAPALELVASASGTRWRCGDGAAAQQVTGTAADLAAWLTGRATGTALRSAALLPALPAWL